MVDRKYRPIAPTSHTDEREHRRLLADRANASMPKDGTEGMQAPLRLNPKTAAELTGTFAASLWEGATVFVSDENTVALSDGANWIRFPSTPVSLANGGTGVSLADPNADRVLFWDDSAGQMTFLAPNTGLVISGTNLNISTVPVANGGTGQTTAAEAVGELIQACSSLNPPDRINDTVGVYDASADTGTQTPIYALAGAVVLSSGSAAGATLDLALDIYTQFKIFKLYLVDIIPVTDAVVPWIRFSDDGGSTFEADAADYSWLVGGTDNAANAYGIGDVSDSEIELSGTVGNASGEGGSWEITINNPAGTGTTRMHWIGHRISEAAALFTVQGAGYALVAGASTDVRFLFSSGNIASGTYTLMGIA